jgi:hypothetical protein
MMLGQNRKMFSFSSSSSCETIGECEPLPFMTIRSWFFDAGVGVDGVDAAAAAFLRVRMLDIVEGAAIWVVSWVPSRWRE